MADKAPKDTSLQSTKQMLDDLDALMERMLSIPVSEMGETPPPPDAPKGPKGPSLAASLTLLEPPVDDPAPTVATIAAPAKKPLERRPRTKLSHTPVKPPHFAKPPTNSSALLHDESSPEPLSNRVVPPTVLPELDPLLEDDGTETPTAPRRRGGALLGVNQTFDAATMYLGGVGRWLRGRAGRAVIGFVGVSLLFGAGAWLLKDWLGWNWQ